MHITLKLILLLCALGEAFNSGSLAQNSKLLSTLSCHTSSIQQMCYVWDDYHHCDCEMSDFFPQENSTYPSNNSTYSTGYEYKYALSRYRFFIYCSVVLWVVILFAFVYQYVRHRRYLAYSHKCMACLKAKNSKLCLEKDSLLQVVYQLEQASSTTICCDDIINRAKSCPELANVLPTQFCEHYAHSIASFSYTHTHTHTHTCAQSRLTPSEIRLSVLIAMGLSTATIVKLLCIEDATVKKYRQRIRKKLKLAPEVHLKQYLQHLLCEVSN